MEWDLRSTREKDIGMGSIVLALACRSEPVVAACAAVVGSTRTGRVLHTVSTSWERSSDVCYVGDTR